MIRNWSNEVVAQRMERDTRDELYVSLLGKDQSFHGRQRIGDIMAGHQRRAYAQHHV
ncbi:MAG: hypothetical protein M5U34_08080 [Chloroflexi bacterium]|nr:hypothetical protein [Chloroflexota bacterium]